VCLTTKNEIAVMHIPQTVGIEKILADRP